MSCDVVSSWCPRQFFSVAATVLGSDSADAATVFSVPEEYASIQAALDAAVEGDTVVVAPGTYVENLDFRGKAVELRSAQGPESTIIDGGFAGRVVTFQSGETTRSVVRGFTLRHGVAGEANGLFGGGILIRQSSPTIIDNIIVENRYCSGGGGIGVVSGSPLIEGNYIANSLQFGCSGGSGGGGIGVDGFFSPASPVIQRNVVENTSSNSAFGSGISLFGAGEAVVSSNIIRFNTGGNFGGGISVSNGAAPLIVQNLIVGNTGRTGGIEVITPWGTAGARIFSNTVAANDGFQVFLHQEPSESISHLANNVLVGTDTALFCVAGLALHEVTANNVYSGSPAAYGGACSSMLGADGNISIDPLFVSPGTSDYRLSASSPSIDAGDASLITPPVLAGC